MLELHIYFTLIKEGRALKDKIAIIVYILSVPRRFYYKLTHRSFDRKYIYGVTLKNMDGLFYCADSFNSSVIVSSHHENNLREYFVLKEGVFVDIGSHFGKYAIRLARQMCNNGKVVAVEPEPYNFEILQANVKLNQLTNIYLKNVACSYQDGESYLFVNDNLLTLHSFYRNTGKNILVKTLKLDTLLSQFRINNVDLIKIDVESAELDVMKGSEKTLLTSHPKIIFEAWDEYILKGIEEFLDRFGYRIKPIDNKNYLAY